MKPQWICRVVLGLGVWLMSWPVAAAGTNPPAQRAFTLTNTFDGRPVSGTEHLLSQRAGVEIWRVTFPSPFASELPQNNTVPADYYLPVPLPPGGPPRPAVICLPILNGDEDLTAMMCSVLAARGIPALTFKLPYYGERGPAEGRRALAANPHAFLAALHQAGLEIRRTVDWLQARPEVHPQRVGIAGISLGGIMSATAAGQDARIHRSVLLLAGGDLPAMIHHARETRALSAMIQRLPAAERAEVEARLASFDPLTHAPALRERARQGRVLMLNAGLDEVVPRACTERLADALGLRERVVWFEGLGHYTALAELPRALRMMADFFAQDLPAEVAASAPAGPAVSTNAYHRLLGVLNQLVTMATAPPGPGRCHFLEGELIGRDPEGRALAGEGRVVIGPDGKFMARVKAQPWGEYAAGQGEFPWLMAPVGGAVTVIAGTAQPAAGTQLMHFLDPQHLVKLQLLSGAAAAVMLAPDLAQRWVAAETDAQGLLRVNPREVRYRDHLGRIKFQADGVTPAEIFFFGGGFDVSFKVRGWQTNTVGAAALFEPPEGLPRRAVPALALQRDMAGVLNWLGDQVRAGPPPGGAAVLATNVVRLRPETFLQTYLAAPASP